MAANPPATNSKIAPVCVDEETEASRQASTKKAHEARKVPPCEILSLLTSKKNKKRKFSMFLESNISEGAFCK